VFLIVITYF